MSAGLNAGFVRKESLKWLLFPGTNLHARLRYHELSSHFGCSSGDRVSRVLDAGCGNGMLSYQAYLRGNVVLGISIKQKEVARCEEFFKKFLGIPPSRLSFRIFDLRNIESIGVIFDEIICSEVLEHIAEDVAIIRGFSKILRTGGVLHLCVPNADHPDNKAAHLDEHGGGGHVRCGYTAESCLSLLTKCGFQAELVSGIGGPVRQFFNRKIIALERIWKPLGLPLMFFSLPFLRFDTPAHVVPYSIYVKSRLV